MDSQQSVDIPRTAAAEPLSVWVVDDDPRTAQVLTVLLRMDGYQAEVCSSARVLDRLSQAPPPDVLVMSVSMGRIDAVRSIRQVRDRYPALPIFIITEHPQLVQRLGPEVDPLPAVFTKPVDYVALLASLRGAPALTR